MNKFFVLLSLWAFVTTAVSAEMSPKGKVTGYYTGWGKDALRVTIDGASYIEGDCPTKDGYITIESDNTGFKSHSAALLSAYMSGKEVRIVVEGCINNRPRIWGVYLD